MTHHIHSRAVSVLGTGKIGSAIVRALVSTSYNVLGYNRTRQKVVDLQALLQDKPGSLVNCETLEDCIAGSSVLISALFDYQANKTVFEGVKDLIDKTVLVVTDMTPDESLELCDQITLLGGYYVEAPVYATPAEIGTTYVGQPEEAQSSHIRHILEALGEVKYVGKVTQAHTLKNSMLAFHLLSLPVVSTAVSLAVNSGVKSDALLEMLGDEKLFPSFVPTYAKKMLEKNYTEDVINDIAGLNKDLIVLKSIGKTAGIDSSLFRHLQELVDRATKGGYSQKDFTVIHEFLDNTK